MRQNKADKIFLKLLKRVRSGKTTTKDVELLMSLHFGKLFGKEEKGNYGEGNICICKQRTNESFTTWKN
jgi:hypothetical protein